MWVQILAQPCRHPGMGMWGNSYRQVGAKQEERSSFHSVETEVLEGSFQTKPSLKESCGRCWA